jgi:hypothetical protein
LTADTHCYSVLADQAVFKISIRISPSQGRCIHMASREQRSPQFSVIEPRLREEATNDMTDEFDIGLFMKRVRTLQELFGDAGFHADRVAAMNGY